MIKFERLKGTIVVFIFLIIALCLKGLYAGENQIIFSLFLAFFFVVGPTVLSNKSKPKKIELSKKMFGG